MWTARKASECRDGGLRFPIAHTIGRTYGDLGFRLNGVARGGSCWETTHALNDRVGRRLSNNVLSQRGGTLGFRLNGVRVDRGGRWGLGPDYTRCSYRDRSMQNGYRDIIGFL